VEDNYFHECDGEAEIISNKSCENVYHHNVFDRCSGALTLRHGHRCLVDGNVFLGRRKGGTGGIRIIGQDHSVTNNYFEGLRGDAERAAICMMNGIPNGSLNSYAPVKAATVAHNSLIDCKVPMEFGLGDGKKQSAIPTGCRVINNFFLSDKWPLLRIHAKPIDCVWEGNKRHGRANEDQPFEFEHIDLQLRRAADGLLRPTSITPLLASTASTLDVDLDGHSRDEVPVAGCDQPGTPFYSWPSASNTGPSWSQESQGQ
jgi:poly(beta-D-mannuronate) lyase